MLTATTYNTVRKEKKCSAQPVLRPTGPTRGSPANETSAQFCYKNYSSSELAYRGERESRFLTAHQHKNRPFDVKIGSNEIIR